jgi:hypothetical protein
VCATKAIDRIADAPAQVEMASDDLKRERQETAGAAAAVKFTRQSRVKTPSASTDRRVRLEGVPLTLGLAEPGLLSGAGAFCPCGLALKAVDRNGIVTITVFAFHSKHPNPRCPVGRNIQRGLLGHYRKAQAAMEEELAQSTIADVLRDVVAAGKNRNGA